jgi:hypothetical protein
MQHNTLKYDVFGPFSLEQRLLALGRLLHFQMLHHQAVNWLVVGCTVQHSGLVSDMVVMHCCNWKTTLNLMVVKIISNVEAGKLRS